MRPLTLVSCFVFLLLWAQSAFAQVTTLETLSVAPPNPTIADNVVASAGGTVNETNDPAFRTEWKIEGDNILMDVLHEFDPYLAPPQIEPYTEQATLGNLPAGTYNLTARLFSSDRAFSTYDMPWNFPAMDIRIVSTMSTTFTVVPEPSTLLLAVAGAVLLLRRREARRI